MILGVPHRPGLWIMVAAKPVDFRKGLDLLLHWSHRHRRLMSSPATPSFSAPSDQTG